MLRDKDEERRKSLVKRTAEALHNVQVGAGAARYITYASWSSLLTLDKTFGIDGKNKTKHRKSAEEHISDTPIADYMFESIFADISESKEPMTETNGSVWRLGQFPAYADLDVAAERLVAGFFDVPFEYEITIPLDDDAALLVDVLADKEWPGKFRFVRFDDAFKAMHPLPEYATARTITRMAEGLHWPWPGAGGIQFSVSGYIGKVKKYAPQHSAFQQLQAIAGLAWSYQVIDFDSMEVSKFSYHEGRYVIHVRENGELKFDSFGKVSAGVSRMLKQMTLETSHQSTAHPELLMPRAQQFGDRIREVLELSSDEQRRVVRGAKWLCDSLCAEDETLAFVQATIALEILLSENNDNNDLSLGALYKNRCAYALGTSHNERLKLMKDVGDIYSIRSNIVHAGDEVLSDRERLLLIELRFLLARLLRKEVKMIEFAKVKK